MIILILLREEILFPEISMPISIYLSMQNFGFIINFNCFKNNYSFEIHIS
jgi:hypothetical protein